MHWRPRRPFVCSEHGAELVDDSDAADVLGVAAWRLRQEHLGLMAWKDVDEQWVVGVGQLEVRAQVEAIGVAGTVRRRRCRGFLVAAG